MKILHSIVLFTLVGLSACGGGGGGDDSSTSTPAPSSLAYLDNDRLEISQVEIEPILPILDGHADSFRVTPELPAGIFIDAETGVIAGRPIAPSARRTYDVAATNAGGSAHFDLVLRVVAPPRYVYATSRDDNAFSAFADDVFTGALVRTGQTVTGGGESTPEKLVVHRSGRFAYAPNLATGNVSVFTIDPDTGWLVRRSAVACGAGPHAMAIDPSGNFACVTNRGSDEIYVYAIDPSTGDLTQTSAPEATGTQPSAIEFDRTGTLIFVTMRGRDDDGLGSVIQCFTLDAAAGRISAFNSALKLNGGRPISLCVDPIRDVLYVTLEAFARVLPVHYTPASGALAPVSLRPVGTSPVAIGVEARGHFAYVVSQDSNTIDAFRVQPTTAALTYFATYGAGTGPTSLALDPTGRFAYVTTETSHELITYSIDPQSGALSALESRLVRGAVAHVALGSGDHPNELRAQNVYVTAASSNDVTSYVVDQGTGALQGNGLTGTGAAPASIALDPRGRFAWVANEGAHTISIFTVDSATGGLGGSIAAQPIDGQPSHVTVDPTARFLYVVAHDVVDPDDGWLSTYAIDQATGELALLGQTQVGLRPSSVGVDPTGRFIYAANSGTSIPDATSISVFKRLPSGLPVLSAPPASAPGVLGLGFHPNGRFAYGVLAGADTVAQYSIDAATGALSIVPPGSNAGPEPVAIAFSPNARFAFVASRDSIGGGNLASYAVAPDGQLGDALEVLPDGVYPTDVVCDPSGRFLWATNSATDNVSVIRIAPVTGHMKAGLPATAGVAPSAIAIRIRSN